MEERVKRIYFTSIEKQVLTTYTNFFRFYSVRTTPVFMPNMWANENTIVDTRSKGSNSGPYAWEADALRHNYGNHTKIPHFLLHFVV